MTCIVGLVHKHKVYIGGDGGGFVGGTIFLHDNGKVFRSGEFIFGCAGNRRFGEIIRFAFTPPEIDDDVQRYMATTFTAALRGVLREQGYLLTKAGREQANESDSMLVGIQGQLFYVPGEFSASAMLDGMFATGCGMDFALGALYVTKDLAPEDRIRQALAAAERWSSGVVGPFHVESI